MKAPTPKVGYELSQTRTRPTHFSESRLDLGLKVAKHMFVLDLLYNFSIRD